MYIIFNLIEPYKTYEGEIKLITNFQRARDGESLVVNELDKWTPEGIMKKERPQQSVA